MPRFRFRLAASLRLAEQELEERQRLLADEIRRREEILARRDDQEKVYLEGIEGQRQAGCSEPERLGYWQKFCVDQLAKLRELDEELKQQTERVEKARQELFKAHQEKEKFRRLKAKRWLAFQLQEQRREQALLDEAGQIIHFRQKKENDYL